MLMTMEGRGYDHQEVKHELEEKEGQGGGKNRSRRQTGPWIFHRREKHILNGIDCGITGERRGKNDSDGITKPRNGFSTRGW